MLAAVAKQPGITAGDVAKRLKTKPNYIYRLVGELREEGRIKKGRQLFDEGSEIDPSSPSIRGAVVSWSNAGVEQEARLH